MSEKFKHRFWNKLRPIYSKAKKTRTYKRIIHTFHNKRQNNHLGWLKEGFQLENLIKHLNEKGFEQQDIAWLDPHELLSLRKLDNSVFQYHLRIFQDGEVRGHYEYAPEDYALRHVFEIGITHKPEDFYNFLEGLDYFEPGRTTSQSAPAASRTSPSKG